VTFPPGAVASDVLLVVRRLDKRATDVPPPPEGYVAGDTLLDIRVATLDGRQINTFPEEIDLCVTYSQGDLTAANDDASLLVLGWYEESLSQWEIPDPKLDTNADTICVRTSKLSLWMVFAKIPGTSIGGGLGLWWIAIGIGIFLGLLLGLLFVLRRRGLHRAEPYRFENTGGVRAPEPVAPDEDSGGVRAPGPTPPGIDSGATRTPGPSPPRPYTGRIYPPIPPPAQEEEKDTRVREPSPGQVGGGRIPDQESVPVPRAKEPEPPIAQPGIGRVPPLAPTPPTPKPESPPADETSQVDPATRVQAQLTRALLRVQQTLWRLDNLGDWDNSIPRDIISALSTAAEDIKGTSEPTKSTLLLTRLEEFAGEMEASLEVGLDRALYSASMAVVAEVFEALRACRVAQFVARVTKQNPEFLREGSSLVSYLGKGAVEVSFSGEVTRVFPRHCFVAGVKVILPADEEDEGQLSPGDWISVEGVLGPGAVVFSTELRTL